MRTRFKVVKGTARQPEVRQVQRGSAGSRLPLSLFVRRIEPDGNSHYHDQQERRSRKQSLGAVSEEAEEIDPTVPFNIFKQEPGYQEAGDHEKNVHANKAAG